MKRNLKSSLILTATFVAIMLLASEREAYAYIDPGAGGMLLQLLLGGFAGAAVVVKLYWNRIKDGFRRVFKRETSEKKTDLHESDLK